ncbi:MAG: EthD domain-containing protein [Caenibius sp.]
MIRRKEGMSYEEFSEYWRDVHAPLAREHGDVLGVLRYVQVRPLRHPQAVALAGVRGTPIADFDGIAEVWWDSLDMDDPSESVMEIVAGILDDERRFIDLEHSLIWFGVETVEIGHPSV